MPRWADLPITPAAADAHLSADMTPLTPQPCDGKHVGVWEALQLKLEQNVVLSHHSARRRQLP